jgi:hypothetical protein
LSNTSERTVARKGEIQAKLKIALDETRMLVMGVQILVGFQFQAIIQDRFASLPLSSRICVGAVLILMVCTAGLLIAPAARHRLVEDGNASSCIIVVTTRFMTAALLAFAIGIAFAFYVAMEQIAGFSWALMSALAAFAVALVFWFGWALIFPTGSGKKERAMTEPTDTPLAEKINYMLTEARVVLPGVQALLGFQLIAVLSRRFEQLPMALKAGHAVGLGMMMLAVVLLLAPAAFHRLAFGGEDVPLVHKVGSILVTVALTALALGLSAEVMVALGALSGRLDVGALIAAMVLLLLFGLWYVWPLIVRSRLRSSQRRR